MQTENKNQAKNGAFVLKQLKEKISREGKVLPGGIIKVDGFLNHRVDAGFLRLLAEEFAHRFSLEGMTAVVTIEASGIPLATVCALEWGVPMIFAKKAKSDNIEGGLYKSDTFSYTYQKSQPLIMAQEWLGPEDKVLVVDDFLAKGSALSGIIDIIDQSGAELIGLGVAVEKGFQGGGDRLRADGYNLQSLAIIEQADDKGIVFRE